MDNGRQKRAAISVHMAQVRPQRQEVGENFRETFPTCDLDRCQAFRIRPVILRTGLDKPFHVIELAGQVKDQPHDVARGFGHLVGIKERIVKRFTVRD